MIEFYGTLSDECSKYVLRKSQKAAWFVGAIVATIFSVPTIILALKVDLIIIIFVPVYIIIALLNGVPVGKKDYNKVLPSKITIDLDSGIISSENEIFYFEKEISDIISVNDMGEWYHIYFGDRVDRIAKFVCQKDLLHGCTIEDFEKMFEDELVREVIKKDR